MASRNPKPSSPLTSADRIPERTSAGTSETAVFQYNPYFVPTSSLYGRYSINDVYPELNASFWPPDDPSDMPPAFFLVDASRYGYEKGYPVFFPIDGSQADMVELLAYLKDGHYLDDHSKMITVQVCVRV
jgi:hypothetical protein